MRIILILMVHLAMLLFLIPAVAEESIGESLYKKHCIICHGDDLKGKPALATMFKIETEKLNLTTDNVKNDTDEELLKVIDDGIEKMPAYKDKLTQGEQKELLKYIRETSIPAQP